MRLRPERAFTATELLIVIGLLCICLFVGLPWITDVGRRSKRIGCTSNLKQIGLAAKTWAIDNSDRFPSEVPPNEGGAWNSLGEAKAVIPFLLMSNELSTAKILVCPTDSERPRMSAFASLTRSNLSYFWGVDVTSNAPNLWLSGDRNLTNRSRIARGLLVVSSNAPAVWTSQLHNRQGNVCLADGSVQQLSNPGLSRYQETNRILLP